jgi:hypothetical protein
VALEAPPNEGLIDLMSTQDEGKGGEQEKVVSASQMATRVNAYCRDDNATCQIAFR